MNRNTRRIITALTAATILLVLSLGIAYAFAITVDGSTADWGAVAATATDPSEAGILQDGRDVLGVWVTTDATKMYFRVDTHTTTLWRSVPSDWAWICLNTDNNTATGTSYPTICSGMTGIDYVLELRGAGVGTRTLYSCTTDPGGNCNTPVGGAVTEGAAAGLTTEASVLLSNLGNLGSGCSTALTVPLAIYWDGANEDIDDHVNDSTPFNVTIPCPTAVTLSNVSASAESNGLPVLPIAAMGLVAVAGIVVVTRRRK